MCHELWYANYALIRASLAGPDGELPGALQKLDPRTVEMVCLEILDGRSSVQWDDIAGQDQAKRLVQELVVWPMLNPHLFKASRLPTPCNSACQMLFFSKAVMPRISAAAVFKLCELRTCTAERTCLE